jgi:hypothetical protein
LVIFVNVPAGSAGKLSSKPKSAASDTPKTKGKKPVDKQKKK